MSKNLCRQHSFREDRLEREEREISPISWLGIARLACRVLYDSHHPLLGFALCTDAKYFSDEHE